MHIPGDEIGCKSPIVQTKPRKYSEISMREGKNTLELQMNRNQANVEHILLIFTCLNLSSDPQRK